SNWMMDQQTVRVMNTMENIITMVILRTLIPVMLTIPKEAWWPIMIKKITKSRSLIVLTQMLTMVI
ncbi:hypothetical protein, partial [Pontimicrobium sp. MEBiC01747]